jgi:tryptophan synthase alpha chain
MSYIQNYINELNKNNRKVLSIFLTAGFPNKHNFVDLAKSVLDSGADMIELGIPFSDPLADGPVIQATSKLALDSGVTLKHVLSYSESITTYTPKPIILMGYANPIKKYGIQNFLNDSANAGIKGLIVPDVPIEEYDSFFAGLNHQLDLILLTTPTSSEERIKNIDERSSGFVYCVSITGTTGVKDSFQADTLLNIERTYSVIKKNKMLIGFGVSTPANIEAFSPYCDGVIVGSRIMKSLLGIGDMCVTLEIISELSNACNLT